MAKMKAVQVPKPGADFEVVEREIPAPGSGQVRIRVQACGVCHSDVVTKDGLFPGMSYPRVPGHEVAGVIDEVGAGVKDWKKGERVGVGWHGGQDGTCPACRRGDFVNCANGKVCGLSYDGGYQEFMIAPVEALARMPESLDAAEAAPLMCAGITTFNALRHSGALPSDLVAIQGIGGLGHLGIQFAKKFGYRVAAISRGPDKRCAREKAWSGSLYRQRRHGCRGRTAETRRRARDSCHRAQREIDVGTGRRPRGERHTAGCGSLDGPDRSAAHAVDYGQEANPGLVGWDSNRLRGHAALRGNDWRPPNDRKVPARESR